MKKILGGLLIAAFALTTQAGRQTIEASHTVKADPQFAMVSIQVTSECYKNSVEANTANAEAAMQVVDALKALLPKDPGKFDSVKATAGHTTRFTRRDYVDNHEVVSCKNTWQQTTTIRFKTGDLDNFSKTFAALQSGTLKIGSKEEMADGEKPVTFTEISSPSYDVCPQMREEMQHNAYQKALQKAQREYSLTASCCNIKGAPEYLKIQRSGNSFAPPKAMRYESAAMSEERVLEIDITQVSETESVSIEFEFPTTFLQCKEMSAQFGK